MKAFEEGLSWQKQKMLSPYRFPMVEGDMPLEGQVREMMGFCMAFWVL